MASTRTARATLDTPRSGTPLLEITDLGVSYAGGVDVLRGVSFSIAEGEIVGLAGESGCGKSTAVSAIMGLLPYGASAHGSIRYAGQEILGLPAKKMRRLRGGEIAAVFQETTTALNPVVRVGEQLVRAVRAHADVSKSEATERVTEALRRVRLHDTERVLSSYAGELSGGMSQRVLIAMALGCGSRLLLADEPTTALDVSVQQEILELLTSMAGEGLSVLMISHDLGVLNEISSRLMVLYGGELVEQGPTSAMVSTPMHPYSRALLECVPRLRTAQASFPEIPEPRPEEGQPQGCLFRNRCPLADDECLTHPSLTPVDVTREVRCWKAPVPQPPHPRGDRPSA